MQLSELIKSHIDTLKSRLVTDHLDYMEEHLFGGVCIQNQFFEGEMLDYTRWDANFTDSGSDGGIDWICVNPSEDNTMKFVQTKYTTSQPSSTQIASDMNKLVSGSERLKNRDNTLSQKVTDVYESHENLVDENFKKEYHLFYACSISDLVMESAKNLIITEHPSINFFVHQMLDIESQIQMNMDETPYVIEDKLKFLKEHGKIEIPEGGGVVLNISAKSLRNLFKRKRDKGLFTQNLRKFIKKPGVDNAIDHTLNNQRDKFWERNNGIIITCEEYAIDGDQIKLFNFSIVNGCQTTNRIGLLSGADDAFDDFPIVCKVIPCKNDEDRIEKIAEASNRQKAIKDDDLKSNSPEQKRLKNSLKSLNPPVSIRIKKGEKHERGASIKSTNKALGQLILSCLLQKPGTARSSTSKIFNDTDTYQQIFQREIEAKSYRDLLKLEQEFKEFQKKGKVSSWDQFTSIRDEHRNHIINLTAHAKYFVLAFTVYLIKYKRDSTFSLNDSVRDLGRMGELFNPNASDIYIERLHKLWNKILKILTEYYSRAYNSGVTSSTSNYCKTDKKYRELIPEIVDATADAESFRGEFDLIMEDVFKVN